MALTVLILILALGGAWFWARSWMEKQITPAAASDPRAMARIQEGRTGPGFGGELGFLASGPEDGPRIVFVHGTPGEARGWLDYLANPQEDYRLLAYDRPGFGRSEAGPPLPSLAAQARVLARFLKLGQGRRTILIGHSLGGPIVCRAAAVFPDRVAGVVVISGSLDPALEEPTWYQKAASWSLIRSRLPRPLANSLAELMPLRTELEKLAPLLGRVRCPAVIIHGAEDGLVPVANADYLKRKLVNSPRVERIIHPGLGHLLIWKNQKIVEQDLARAVELIHGVWDLPER